MLTRFGDQGYKATIVVVGQIQGSRHVRADQIVIDFKNSAAANHCTEHASTPFRLVSGESLRLGVGRFVSMDILDAPVHLEVSEIERSLLHFSKAWSRALSSLNP